MFFLLLLPFLFTHRYAGGAVEPWLHNPSRAPLYILDAHFFFTHTRTLYFRESFFSFFIIMMEGREGGGAPAFPPARRRPRPPPQHIPNIKLYNRLGVDCSSDRYDDTIGALMRIRVPYI